MPCQVSVLTLVPTAVTVNVIAVAVTVGTISVPVGRLLIFLDAVALPVSRMRTAAAVLNSNPAGALRTIVPRPIWAATVSAMAGLVSGAQVPAALHPGAVFEAMALPPVAGVTVT